MNNRIINSVNPNPFEPDCCEIFLKLYLLIKSDPAWKSNDHWPFFLLWCAQLIAEESSDSSSVLFFSEKLWIVSMLIMAKFLISSHVSLFDARCTVFNYSCDDKVFLCAFFLPVGKVFLFTPGAARTDTQCTENEIHSFSMRLPASHGDIFCCLLNYHGRVLHSIFANWQKSTWISTKWVRFLLPLYRANAIDRIIVSQHSNKQTNWMDSNAVAL